MKTDAEKVPDAAEVIRDLDPPSSAASEPRLDAVTLGAIDAILNGAGGEDFGGGGSLASGGSIGGGAKANVLDSALDKVFSVAEIDQRPRAVYQSPPIYPSEMRGKKVEGVVTVIFVVDSTGRVLDRHVESSSHPAFEKPALDAVRQWKF